MKGKAYLRWIFAHGDGAFHMNNSILVLTVSCMLWLGRAAAGKILDNVVPAGSNPGLDSPVTPAVTPTEEFTVYEAKPSDYGNPLFGADLTPLPGMAPKPPVSTAAPTAGVEEGGTADIQDDDGSDENASPAQ